MVQGHERFRERTVRGESGSRGRVFRGESSSQLRYQHHTEDAWETNAKELTGRVTAEAREVGAGHWRTQLAHDRGVQGLAAAMTALGDGGAAELLLADR